MEEVNELKTQEQLESQECGEVFKIKFSSGLKKTKRK